MPSALIVSAGEKGQAVLRDMLSASRFDRVTTVSNGSDARRALISQGYELVVINTPLTDEFGHELAAHASAGGAGVIMLCKAEHAEQLGAALEREGVFVMSKPLTSCLAISEKRSASLSTFSARRLRPFMRTLAV